MRDPADTARTATPPRNDLVLRAMRGAETQRTPVWLMRQAGRFDPAYRALRERAGLELEDLFAHPAYAAEITLLPLRFGVDAAILFQDILTLTGPMGAPFVFRPGPRIDRPLESAADADRLEVFDPWERLDFVRESIERALEKLDNERPLLGFAGAPFTLFAFLVCGGSVSPADPRPLVFIKDHPLASRGLLQRLAQVTGDYLRMQIAAGVHAVQLFESCAPLLPREDYERWALPYQQAIFQALDGLGVPRILFARGTAPLTMAASSADVLSVGSGIAWSEARSQAKGAALQGNVSNELLRDGTPAQVAAAAAACIREGGCTGHVLNLGHGVLKETPVENVKAMIHTAHELTRERLEGSP